MGRNLAFHLKLAASAPDVLIRPMMTDIARPVGRPSAPL